MIAEAAMDGVSAIALVLIASFAIDRVVNGILFLLSFNKHWAQYFAEPQLIDEPTARSAAERRYKFVYFGLAFVFGMVLLAGFGHVRILAAMGIHPAPTSVPPAAPAAGAPVAPTGQPHISQWLFSFLDVVFTGLLLMGGADSIARLLKLPGAPGVEKPSPQPIEITGKLTLEERGSIDRSK